MRGRFVESVKSSGKERKENKRKEEKK